MLCVAYRTPTSPSFISTPALVLRETVFCCVCRALQHLAARPPSPLGAPQLPTALLLLPHALCPQLESALSALVDLLDGVHPAPASTAAERLSLAALPRGLTCSDLSRVSVKYLSPMQPASARQQGKGALLAAFASSAAAAAPGGAAGEGAPAGAARDLLTFAAALHGLEPRPGWVGLVAPELLVGQGPMEGAAPPPPDALALNAALALLAGAPGSPALHLHLVCTREEAGEAVARVLQRAAVPLQVEESKV